MRPNDTVARVMLLPIGLRPIGSRPIGLRPIGSVLPLGAFALVTSGLLLAERPGLAGGEAAADAIILAASARFLFSGLYELTNATGVERAAGIVGLVFVGVSAYVGFATLLEDSARRSLLPIGRRGSARVAFASGVDAQLNQIEHEAGVRQQL